MFLQINGPRQPTLTGPCHGMGRRCHPEHSNSVMHLTFTQKYPSLGYESPCATGVLIGEAMESQARLPEPSESILTVTNRTVRNGDSIFPTRNISYFGPGEKPLVVVPNEIIIATAFIGLLLTLPSMLFGDSFSISAVLWAAVGMIVWNRHGPVRHGIVLIVNSGDRMFFATRDRSGRARIAATIQTIFERLEVESKTSFDFSDKRVTITHSSVSGTVNTGDYSDSNASETRDFN